MVKYHYLVAYDITQDKIRYDVANCCKNVGLERIQFSVFLGALSSSKFKDLKTMIADCIVDSDAIVHYFPLCKTCFSKVFVQTAESSENQISEDQNDTVTAAETKTLLNFEKAVLIF